jgi:uncharacterized membrane protein YfcA
VIVLALIVFAGVAVGATAGFGAAVVSVSLAAQLRPIDEVLAIFIPVNVLLSAYIVVRYRHAVDVRFLLRRVLPFMGAGVAAGVALFQLRHLGFLKPAFACFVVLLALIELARRGRPPPSPLSRTTSAATLAGAGVIHGLFACGGPLAVYAIGREILEKGRFRATLSTLWLIFNVVLVSSYLAGGGIDPATLGESALLCPSLLLGVLAGEQLHDRVSADRFRQVVSLVLLAAGVALLVRSI